MAEYKKCRPITAELTVSGDKSISHRAVMMADNLAHVGGIPLETGEEDEKKAPRLVNFLRGS